MVQDELYDNNPALELVTSGVNESCVYPGPRVRLLHTKMQRFFLHYYDYENVIQKLVLRLLPFSGDRLNTSLVCF